MSNRKLALLVGLRDRRALKQIAKELRRGDGAKAAAAALGISRVTLYRWGGAWVDVGRLLKRYALGPDQVASMGGSQTAENRKAEK